MKHKKGFTLAEVLITLGIIGVVAAITIPTLIQKTDKAQYLTKLKKAYSQGNEALKLMSNDMGCPNDLKCTGLFDEDKTNESFGKEFVKYFKVVKDCGTTSQDCFSHSYSYTFDGSAERSNFNQSFNGHYRFITADGMSIDLYNDSSGCIANYSYHSDGPMSQYCGSFVVDLNGPDKGPNNVGKDIFEFWITNGKGALLYPEGGSDDTMGGNNWKDPDTGEIVSCSTDPGLDKRTGWGCAGRIIDEGWNINYY